MPHQDEHGQVCNRVHDEDMRAGRNTVSGESEIYLQPEEAEMMKEMVRGASLPLRRVFNKLLTDI